VEHGVAACDIFVGTGPVAAKDSAHTLAIGDVAAWLSSRDRQPDEILPAWLIQRVYGDATHVVPDLIAKWSVVDGDDAVLVVEVDLGSEPIRSVLSSKLPRLRDFVDEAFRGSSVAVTIFVVSSKRAESMKKIADPLGFDVRLLDEIRTRC
jgi:hypothetical protein